MELRPHVGFLQHLARLRANLTEPYSFVRFKLIRIDATLAADGLHRRWTKQVV